jgi:hypothetical protein
VVIRLHIAGGPAVAVAGSVEHIHSHRQAVAAMIVVCIAVVVVAMIVEIVLVDGIGLAVVVCIAAAVHRVVVDMVVLRHMTFVGCCSRLVAALVPVYLQLRAVVTHTVAQACRIAAAVAVECAVMVIAATVVAHILVVVVVVSRVQAERTLREADHQVVEGMIAAETWRPALEADVVVFLPAVVVVYGDAIGLFGAASKSCQEQQLADQASYGPEKLPFCAMDEP